MKMMNEYEVPIVEIISVSTETDFAQSTPPYDGEVENYEFLDEIGWGN